MPVGRLMKALLYAGTLFVLAAGTQLYVLASHTDRFFAWTIANPLTASAIGAFYLAAAAISFLGARAARWEGARVGVPGVLVFVWLTLFSSLRFHDVFHLDGSGLARIAAWAWFAIYVLDPPLLLLATVLQLRSGARQAARSTHLLGSTTHPCPTGYVMCAVVLALPTLAAGAALYLSPRTVGTHWVWRLTPIAAQALGAWLFALGLLLLAATRERDWLRLLPASAGMVLLGGLQLVADIHYRAQVSGPGGAVWIVFFACVFAMGVWGLSAGRRRAR